MGTSGAVVLSSLFLGILEETIFPKKNIAACFIDDGFIVDGFIVAQRKSTDTAKILMLIRS